MAARQGSKGTKRSKGYFRKCSSGKRPHWERKLDVGMKGVLITCNSDERQCIREAYDLLTEYADELYGRELDPGHSDEFDSDEGDIADALEKEVSQMKQQRDEKKLRFQAIDSRAKNVVFIRTKIGDDPANLIHHMLMKMKDSGKCKSKHIQRILPVSMTCRATLDQIEKALKPLLEPVFHSAEAKDSTFAVLFKARNNNQVHKGEVITVVANAVISGAKCKHSVDLEDPNYFILVEVVCNVCCLSILKDYHSLKKYNVHAIVGDEVSQVSRSKADEKIEVKQKPVETEEEQRDCPVLKSSVSLENDGLVATRGAAESKCTVGDSTSESSEEKQKQEGKGTKNDDIKSGVQSVENESKESEEEGNTLDDGIRIF